MHPRALLPLALLLLALLFLTQKGDRRGPLGAPAPPSLINHGATPPSSKGQAASPSSKTSSDQSSPLLEAIASGRPVALNIDGETPERFLFRPRRTLVEDFRLALGTDEQTLDVKPAVFEGFALTPGRHHVTVTAAVAGDALGAVIRGRESVTYIRSHPVTGELQAQSEDTASLDTHCAWDPERNHYAVSSGDPVPDGEAFWAQAKNAELTPDTAALTGLDPATGLWDKYINRIARTTGYDASLSDALMLLVLDKEATGSGTRANLTSKASLFLATVSNVAAAYENQLGIRLLVQEMIMIPDESEFTDIPSDGIEDFRDWIRQHRRNHLYGWNMAAKFGAGLDGQTLGVAFVEAIGNNSAVSLSRATARWDVLAHEMGHNLGSDHSQGGIMNATSSGGSNRSFFTDVTPGETAAKDIYDYSHSRLRGTGKLRHPEQIPFARRDFESTPLDTPITLSPLNNDDEAVRNGARNTLSLDGVSAVTPLEAGKVTIFGNDVRFTPSAGFQGTAWFSYALRGNVGNQGQGWLHKGDVAIQVGIETPSLSIDLAPGASYSFVPSNGTSGLTQPAHAVVTRSRDDSSLLIIRVAAGATGSDTFRSGGRTYTLEYSPHPTRVTDDHYVYEPAKGPLVFNPLLNDEGAGEPWINPIKPAIGVGTFGHDVQSDELFPTTFRLVSVTNRHPEKGTLSTRTLPFINDGKLDNRLDSTLTFAAKSGASGTALIDYTVSDAAGKLATGVVEIVLPSRIDTLVAEGDPVRYHVPADASEEHTWMLPNFDDSHWTPGITGLGYDTNLDFRPAIATTIENLRHVNTSVFIRLPFESTKVAEFTHLVLRMKVDDGFIAYLNGEEVARSSNLSAPSPLPWNATTLENANDSQALTFASFDVTDSLHLLQEGPNVLAIHGVNGSLSSSDFLIVPELEAAATGGEPVLQSPAPQTQFENWLSQFSLAENESSPNDDADGDGFDNLEEYAFGGDPTVNNSDEQLAPRLERSLDGTLTFNYTRRSDAAARGLDIVLEHSVDLRSWQPEDDLTETLISRDPLEEISVTLPVEDLDSGFWRLRISIEQ